MYASNASRVLALANVTSALLTQEGAYYSATSKRLQYAEAGSVTDWQSGTTWHVLEISKFQHKKAKIPPEFHLNFDKFQDFQKVKNQRRFRHEFREILGWGNLFVRNWYFGSTGGYR